MPRRDSGKTADAVISRLGSDTAPVFPWSSQAQRKRAHTPRKPSKTAAKLCRERRLVKPKPAEILAPEPRSVESKPSAPAADARKPGEGAKSEKSE